MYTYILYICIMFIVTYSLLYTFYVYMCIIYIWTVLMHAVFVAYRQQRTASFIHRLAELFSLTSPAASRVLPTNVARQATAEVAGPGGQRWNGSMYADGCGGQHHCQWCDPLVHLCIYVCRCASLFVCTQIFGYVGVPSACVNAPVSTRVRA